MGRWIVALLFVGLASCASSPGVDQERAIEIARREVRARTTWEARAKYTATRDDGGWSVFVQRVEGRSPQGEDLIQPGGHCTVMIDGQGRVTDFYPGE
jgi:hypothetical protein